MTIDDRISTRSVCFIDILGFRNMVDSVPLSELATMYQNIFLTVEGCMRPRLAFPGLPSLFPEHTQGQPYCIGTIFSDSFIFVANDSSTASCLKLLVFSWRVLQALLAQRVPVRGGVMCGQLYTDQTRGIIIGPALTEAYELEKRQDWVGVALDPSVEQAYPALFGPPYRDMAELLFPTYAVPIKSGPPASMRILNWRFNLVAKHGTKALFHASDRSDVRRKISNTLEYARWVVDGGKVYAVDQSEYPVELRTFWIGETEPPFLHGDEF